MPNYFTNIHEQAIIEYLDTDDTILKHHLYNKVIYKAFNEMIIRILNSKKFSNLPQYKRQNIIDDCPVYLYESITKFKTDRETKPFYYFTQLIINYIYRELKIKTPIEYTDESFDSYDFFDETISVKDQKTEDEDKLTSILKITKNRKLIEEYEDRIFDLYFMKENTMLEISNKIGISNFITYRLIKDLRIKIRNELGLKGPLIKMNKK